MKECTRCHQVKELDAFSPKRSWCKTCKNEYEKERRSKNREKINTKEREKYQEKKTLNIQPDTDIIKICSLCMEEKTGDNFYRHSSGRLRSECKDCASQKRKEHYQNNREKIIKQTSEYTNNRVNNDINFKLERRLRSRLYHAFMNKNQVKKQRTMKYVQCTPNFFSEWIKFQLYDGMTMENYGAIWHIDHCKPCCMFDFSEDDEVYECFHWKNMRPYLSKKNLEKNIKYNPYDTVLQDIKAHVYLKGLEKHSA